VRVNEARSIALGEIDEAVLETTNLPDSPARDAVDVCHGVGVARSDQIIAHVVFLDGVDVEPIPRISTRAYQRLVSACVPGTVYFLLTCPVTPTVDCHVLELEMVASTPLEEEVIRFHIDLLENTVPYVAILPAMNL